MKHNQVALATAALLALAGAAQGARAQSRTLYTPVMHSGEFDCNVLNASDKTLTITVSILDQNGNPLAVSSPTETGPGAEASNGYGTIDVGIDAYCAVKAVGTGDPADLRVVLNTQFVKTFDEGSQTNIPVFIPRTVLGY